MRTFNITYVVILSFILIFLPVHYSGPTTVSAQSGEQEPAKAIEDTYVPQSKEGIKAEKNESKSTEEGKAPAKKGKASGKKGNASVKREKSPTNPDGPTAADVREAKREQGLKGYFFQDSKSKKYFLQDFDGNMYKFVDNKWVKIKEGGE